MIIFYQALYHFQISYITFTFYFRLDCSVRMLGVFF